MIKLLLVRFVATDSFLKAFLVWAVGSLSFIGIASLCGFIFSSAGMMIVPVLMLLFAIIFGTFCNENAYFLKEKIFLKLDVQGFEINILKGLNKFMDNIVAIQVEISVNSIYKNASNLSEFSRWLNENDFRIASIVTERFHEAETQAYDVDILCLRSK
jgi:hypothetical protein